MKQTMKSASRDDIMKKLLKNCRIVDVFTDQIIEADILMEGERIIGVGTYDENDADSVENVGGKYVCPGFIDGHIHIESSMLSPTEFVRACVVHGTSAVVADPHEIVNVSGIAGMEYMLESTENVPMDVYFTAPSCVPATGFDENGATISSEEIEKMLENPRVVGLGEMMNYPGVIFGDPEVHKKIKTTHKAGKVVNGHAPMLKGRDLDKYISAGIFDDHECTSFDEALEKMQKGQWIMIRQGTAARNLEGLIDLFDEPYSRRCLLVTDDKHPADIMNSGHIDNIIRMAGERGKSVVAGIRMATLQAALRFGFRDRGAIAPGYIANVLVLDDLQSVRVRDVYYKGERVVKDGEVTAFHENPIDDNIMKSVLGSFNLDELSEKDFIIKPESDRCRVIRVIPDQLITSEEIMNPDFGNANGISIRDDLLKLAVIERHKNTGHIGLGFITGMGLKSGAIASSVSHDSHNIIVVGTNERDMAAAANCIRDMRGGLAVVNNGEIIGSLALPISGLMGTESASEMAELNEKVRSSAEILGHADGIDPFMNLAFVSLPVIPDIKMTTQGLVNVNKQERIELFVKC